MTLPQTEQWRIQLAALMICSRVANSSQRSQAPNQEHSGPFGSTNVEVSGRTIQNSPQTHLKFDSCMNVRAIDFTASSPGDSPNTDGIYLQNTQNVVISSTNLYCGDDCVSIQTGCSNIDIHNVNCGPGHGISIGGLGKLNAKARVSKIIIHFYSSNRSASWILRKLLKSIQTKEA